MPRGGRGYFQRYDPIADRLYEADTLTCAHCNRVVVLNPERKRARNWCFVCDRYVCDHKVCATECNPIVESVELAQHNNGDDAYLLRGPQGEILFDTRKRRKVY